jgi:hypothetical protein
MIFFYKGFWLDEDKPPYQHFFKKCINNLIETVNGSFENNFTIRVQSLILDMPAKAAIINLKQFNGEYGCPVCLEPGEHNQELHKRVYPNITFKKRTSKEYEFYGFLVENCLRKQPNSKESIYGINGTTTFTKIMNIPDQLPFDYMHLVLQGHCKWIINQYFNESKKSHCYIGKDEQKNEINMILSSLELPHNFNRKLTTLEKMKHWKSVQYKIFFFYAIIPTLMWVLPPYYFYFLCGYVFSIRLLYEPINNEEDIEMAENILIKYVKELWSYFGLYAYDYTVHAHLHLADQVRMHGPLHCHSQFVFEGALYNIKKMLKGTKGYLNQAINKLTFLKTFQPEYENFEFDSLKPFKEKYLTKNYYKKDEISLIAPLENKVLTSKLKNLFKDKFDLDVNEVLSSTRFKNKKLFLHSKNYSRRGKANSYTISFREDNIKKYAFIIEFYKQKNEFFALVDVISMSDLNLPTSDGYFYDKITNGLFEKFYNFVDTKILKRDLIKCDNIELKCIIVKNKISELITEIKYEFEHD